jgi:hypothetical protein
MGYSGVIFAMMESAKEIEKQRKINKLNTMKKEEIYVVIDSEEKRLRAIQILSDAKENISTFDLSMDFSEKHKYLRLDSNNQWFIFSYMFSTDTEINLDQLEQMLSPKQEIKMELDALKLIAESYGFELVEKEREIKVGDFGKFSSENGSVCSYGFLYKMRGIKSGIIYVENNKDITNHWSKFHHLTDEEKQQIQENW